MSVRLDRLDLSKHVIILTGATDGIGKDMARILAGFNPKRLVLPARNKEKGNNLLEYIKSSNGHANNVEIWEMDLADLQSVKSFVNKFINEIGELHILFNNAGNKNNDIVFYYVSHLLTLLLLDTIKKSVSAELPGKIAFTSSGTQRYGKIDFDNSNLEKGAYFGPFQGYANTKLMNIIVTKELSRVVQNKNENITTFLLQPGIIQTNLGHMNSGLSNFLQNLFVKMYEIPAEQGAINVLYPVLSPENKETGKYYHEGIEKEPNEIVEVMKRLWNVSEQILKDHEMI
ncbi:NAD(P)-binding protein [Rhizophagus irregularis]|uniref:NAD(P)-binding protein n=1 Tax=Rhizophagus irregularis TaxID=588596 RepID=A0A2N1NR00_9GLOM|nr:NAD(P)-binding protein [Rhizophagus irregularis]